MKNNYILFFILSSFLFSCINSNKTAELEKAKDVVVDYSNLPLKSEKGNFTAVIEIPAGTNQKYEYNYSTKEFECEIKNGKPRVVKFLPYIGNYGFIPGTYMNPEIGGDGDALDVLVIAESINQGEIVEITPIAILKLLDGGKEDHKIIAIPADAALNIIETDTLSTPIKSLIENWFTNYKGVGKMQFLGWKGKDSTLLEIEKWTK